MLSRHISSFHRAVILSVAKDLLPQTRERQSPTRLSCPIGTLCAFALFSVAATAQQPIGTVSTNDADVTGTIAVHGTVAEIQTGGTVKAGNAAAGITLNRGGKVTVCAHSAVSLSQSTADKAPLMVALQRGAAELHWNASSHDVFITTDLRFDLSNAAPLDVRIRVTPTGDTCVENSGKDAPVLHVTEQFGASAGYFIKPGQKVLFEHGSLHEVVDREGSNCGCPAPLVLAGNSRDPHPFPEAVSQGLEDTRVPQAAPGETHTSISASVSYNGREAEKPAAPGAKPSTANTSTIPPDEPVKDSAPITRPFRAIGRFFKHIFTND